MHFIDTFRFLAGEVKSAYCILRKLNPFIAGEDCGLLVFQFANGAVGTWDANRYNEPNYENPRYTFGEFLIEGDAGAIRLYPDGKLTVQQLGEPEMPNPYKHQNVNFAGDCCYFTQRHFIDRLLPGSANHCVCDPYKRIVKVHDLQHCLQQIHPNVSPLNVSEFVNQNSL